MIMRSRTHQYYKGYFSPNSSPAFERGVILPPFPSREGELGGVRPVKLQIQLQLDLGHQLTPVVQPTLSYSRNLGFQPGL